MSVSHVDFVPNTARPQPTMPADLSKEEFLSMDDVQTSTLPRSQIGVVMASYDKTIGKSLQGTTMLGSVFIYLPKEEFDSLHYYPYKEKFQSTLSQTQIDFFPQFYKGDQ